MRSATRLRIAVDGGDWEPQSDDRFGDRGALEKAIKPVSLVVAAKSMGRALVLFLFFLSTAVDPIGAEDIPLERCDRLPVVEIQISGAKFLFLVDTAATSLLNLQSFAHGDPTSATITSWTGTTETKAQGVLVWDLAIGNHHLRKVRLTAVDLSYIGRNCGRRIDGILGLDLLARFGATIDLKNNTVRISMDPQDEHARVAELERQLTACEQVFNQADEGAFSQCLDPQVVIFAAAGDFYGRDAAIQYYREHYFRHDPSARMNLTPRAHHAIGDAIWMEYDLNITLGERTIRARGTALFVKADGRWRIIHMNDSVPPDRLQTQQE